MPGHDLKPLPQVADWNIVAANNALLKFLKESPYKGFILKTLCGCSSWILERISEFSKAFDDTGELTLLYLASECKAYIDDTVAPVASVLENPDFLKPYSACKEIIESPLVNDSRQNLADKLSAIIAAISGKKLLGGGNAVFSELDRAICALFEGFHKLRFEVYMNSGRAVDGFDNFSSSVQVCGSLAEMLLRLEASRDGIYVGYVSNPGTLDGWFGFFCKSNGNMFSYNERIDEAYVGQHNRLRNGRYAENKAFDLFPYELCEFSSERDYKGYSREVSIGENHNLFNIEDFCVFIRTILSMAVISRKHAGRVLEGKAVVIDSLLPSNLTLLGGHEEEAKAIVKLDGSQLVKAATSFKPPRFEEEKVLCGFYDKEFRHGQKRPYNETGWFNGVNQEIVDAYGDGFKINHGQVLASNSSLRLIGDGHTEQEFVGSQGRFRLRAYTEVRRQLASHVQKKLRDDFDKFGGVGKLKEWYTERLVERMDKVLSCCADAYIQWSDNKNKTRVKYGEVEVQDVEDSFRARTNPRDVEIGERPLWSLTSLSKYEDGRFICPVFHCGATFHFRFCFYAYNQVEEFLECELPKFCVGWFASPLYNGNCLLDVVDPVGEIVHPLRGKFDFSFSISLSKRAIARTLRNREEGGDHADD